jgi:hypothetical protein
MSCDKPKHKTGGTQMVNQQKKNNRKKQSSKGFTVQQTAQRPEKSMLLRNMRPVMSSLAHLAGFWQ